MDEVYNNSKLLISTSFSEGFGRTLTEALSFKIPVISYDCKCGPKEIIKDGVNGYLIDFDVKLLADKILYLTLKPDKLLEFSNNAWIDIDKFAFENIMKQWINLYESFKYEK